MFIGVLIPQVQQTAYAASTWPEQNMDLQPSDGGTTKYHGPRDNTHSDIGLARTNGALGDFFGKQTRFSLYFRHYEGAGVVEDRPIAEVGIGSAGSVGDSVANGKPIQSDSETDLGNGVKVRMHFTGLKNEKIIRVRYTIRNTSDSTKKVTLGGAAVFRLDNREKSAVYPLSKGFLTRSATGIYLSFATDGNFRWGKNSINDVSAAAYRQTIQNAAGKNGMDSGIVEGSYIQPGLSWLWQSVEVPAGGTVDKDCYFSVGSEALGDDPYRVLTAGYSSIITLNPNSGWAVNGMPEGGILGTDKNYNAVLPELTCSSEVFEGWYDSVSGGNKVGDGGATYNAPNDVTLHAHWKALVSTVNVKLKAGSDPYTGQTMQLYEGTTSNTPKYSLTEKEDEAGTYSTGGVSNGTYYIGVNGRRTGDTVKVDADGRDPDSWTTNTEVTLPKATVTTRLDGENSNVPGEVTLRERGAVVYTMDRAETGVYWSGVAFDSNNTPFDIFVDGADTGEDIKPEIITPNSLNKTVDFDTVSVEITDDAAWEDANVALKDSNGRTAYVLPYKSTEGKKTTYSRILPRNGETYKVFVDGMDTGRTVKTDGTHKQAAAAFYTSTLSVSCSDAAGLPMTATLSGNNRKYNYKKGSPEGAAVTYTAKHVLDADAYTLDINGVSAGGTDINKEVSAENKDRNLTVRVIDFQKYSTEDNTSFTPSSDVKGYVFDGGKISSRESRMDGFTFSGWSESGWTPGEASYTAFDFGTDITEDKTLYPHYLSPTVKISGLVRTDADGKENRESGDYYRMPYLTIAGFDTGDQSVKLVMFEGENVESINAKNLPAGATFENGLLTFDPAVSMNEARDYIRDNIVVKPAQKGDGSHEAGTMTVTVIDKNGSIGTGYDGGPVTGGAATGTLTGEGGQVLEDKKIYTVSADIEITGSTTADTAKERSGLIVPENSTVYLYVPEGKTLTVNGGAADDGGDGDTGQHYYVKSSYASTEDESIDNTGDGGTGGTGGGAGIYVPSDSTLYLLGGGTIVATGGAAGNGGNGGNGGDNDNAIINRVEQIRESKNGFEWQALHSSGGGGGGGAGGGGAGAGIGGAGGDGGAGGQGAAAEHAGAQTVFAQDSVQITGKAGTKGSEGKAGSECGTINKSNGVTLVASNGGAGDNGGIGGVAGTNRFGSTTSADYGYPVPGSGGGGGGAGQAAADIGSGGGGAGGGAGGGSGPVRSSNIPNSGAGFWSAGGKGGLGSSGKNGTQGSPTANGKHGAASAAAGAAGAAAGPEVAPGTNITNTITYNDAKDTEGQGTVGEGGTASYTPGTEGTITFPDFTADSGQPLKGWKLTQYAANIGDATNNPFADDTGSKLFAAGSTVQIPEGTVGDLVFSPVTSALSGLSAVDTANYDGTSATIFTYTVTTKVGDKAADVGPLTFKVGDTEELVSGINGVYTFTSSARSAQVKYRGETVIDEMKSTDSDPNPTAEASFEKVKVKVNGYKPSDLTLDNDGPVLACVSSDDATKTYEYESAYRKEGLLKGSYEVSCDGTATGVKASYGKTVEVNYHTVTVKLADSDAEGVVLRDKNGNALEMTKTGAKTFIYTALEEDKTAYDVYADGTLTGATGVKFDESKTVNAGYYVSTVTVKLDGSESDAVGIPQYGDEPMTKTATGVYSFATGSNEKTDVSVNGKVAVKGMTPGSNETVEYFSITYAKAGVAGETGDVPSPTICQKDKKANLEVNTLKNGAMKFGGWKIGEKTYPEGAEVTVTEAVTATATWSKASIEEPDADGNTVLVVFDRDKFFYNGASQTPVVSVYIGTTKLTEGTDYELSYASSNADAPAGEETIWAGKVTVTVAGKGDYCGAVTKDYEIIEKAVSISGVTATERDYNGTKSIAINTGSATLAGVADGDGDKLSISWPTEPKGSVNDPNVEIISDEEYNALTDDEKALVETKDGLHYVRKNVTLETDEEGELLAELGGAKKSCYVLTGANDVKTVINQKEITVTADTGKTKVYGTADPELTYQAGELIEGNSFSGALGRASGENVGEYAINLGTLSAGDNYKINLADNNAKLTITKKEVGLTWDETSFTYNGSEQKPEATATGLEEGDTCTVTVSGGQTDANAKTGTQKYTATASGLSNDNYKLPENVTCDFTIARKDITVSGITASNKTYDGNTTAPLVFTGATLTGKVGEDDLSVKGKDSQNGTFDDKNVGTGKTVTLPALALDGDDAGNYKLAAEGQQTEASANITAKAINVSADDISKTYGAKEPALTYTADQLIGTDEFLGLLVRQTGEDAGTYEINQGTLTAGNNYAINFTPGTFTINKATANAVNVSIEGWTYGEAAKTPTAEAAYGEDTAVFTYSDAPEGEYSAEVPSTAGTWYVKATVPETNNYAGGESEPLEFTIAKKGAEGIDAEQKPGENLVYDGEEKKPTLEVKDGDKNLEEGKDYTVTYVGVEPTEYGPSDIPPTEPGTYKAIVTFDGNYDGTKEVEFTVSKADQKAPSADRMPVTDASSSASKDGKISGVNDRMEYSTDGGRTWKPVPAGANEITGLGKGPVQVRYKETATQKASPAVSIEVGAKPSSLVAKMTHKGKKSMKITWTKVDGADGYDVFLSRCNHSGILYIPRLAKSISGNGTFNWTKKGLKKGKAYKVYVKAYVMKDGQKVYISKSPGIHGFAGGFSKKYTNPKSVKVSKTSVTLNQGQSVKIKASVKKLKKGKRLISTAHAARLRCMSTDDGIATMSGSGVITGHSPGTCVIYVLAANGVNRPVTVTVR